MTREQRINFLLKEFKDLKFFLSNTVRVSCPLIQDYISNKDREFIKGNYKKLLKSAEYVFNCDIDTLIKTIDDLSMPEIEFDLRRGLRNRQLEQIFKL